MNHARARGWPALSVLTGLCFGMATGSSGLLAQTCSAPSNNQIFNASLCVGGQTVSVGSNQLQTIIDTIDNQRLSRTFAGYTPDVTAGEFRLDIRGLPVTLGYDANSTQLSFAVPSLGISKTFSGGTRDASKHLLEDYIKQNGDAILRELLRVSAVDPLAGNPASVQSQMVVGDYEAGVDSMVGTAALGSAFGVGLRFGSYGLDGFTQNVYTLPLSYSYSLTNRDVLMVRLPLTYMEVDGASAYRGMLGLSYKKVLSSRWALTPSLGYGLASSSDLGSFGQILSVSLTSDLQLYNNGRVSLSMGNLLGYYLTLPTRIADYNVNYHLKNTITRDGLLLSIPLQQQYWGREFSLDFFVIGTWFFGDALYSTNYQEIGISIGPRRSADKREPNLASHPFGIGLKYTRGDGNVNGVELTFGYRF